MLVQLSRTSARFSARSPEPSIRAALRQLDGADGSPRSSSVEAKPTEVGPAARAQAGAPKAPSTAAGCGLSAAPNCGGREAGGGAPFLPSHRSSLPAPSAAGRLVANIITTDVSPNSHVIHEITMPQLTNCTYRINIGAPMEKCGDHPEFIWRPPLTNCDHLTIIKQILADPTRNAPPRINRLRAPPPVGASLMLHSPTTCV